MIESNIENKILDLKTNKKFIAMLKETETSKDVQRVFAEFGVDVAEETIEQAMAITSKPDGEIEEDDLEAVCGGISGLTILRALSGILPRFPRRPIILGISGLSSKDKY